MIIQDMLVAPFEKSNNSSNFKVVWKDPRAKGLVDDMSQWQYNIFHYTL